MVTRALGIDLTSIIVEYGAAGVYGAIQRGAWEQSDMLGFLATGGGLLVGILGQTMRGGDILSQSLRAVGPASAAIGGWLVAERMFRMGGVGMGQAEMQEAYVARAIAGQIDGARSAVTTPASHHPGIERINGQVISRH